MKLWDKKSKVDARPEERGIGGDGLKALKEVDGPLTCDIVGDEVLELETECLM